jgi:DNA-directed RNA polymerase subunit M/transcription elongation factor TFIIS
MKRQEKLDQEQENTQKDTLKETHDEWADMKGSALRFMGLSSDNIGVKCIFCGQYTVVYKLVQRRSGDEGMTPEATCTSCCRIFVIGDNYRI